MSQEAKNSLQKFESFLDRLQNGINKGLNCELVTSKIKEVEVKREEEVKIVLPTSEIKKKLKIVIPAFIVKLKQGVEDEVVQKKAKLNGIPKLAQEYTDKHSNYIYFCWV